MTRQGNIIVTKDNVRILYIMKPRTLYLTKEIDVDALIIVMFRVYTLGIIIS